MGRDINDLDYLSDLEDPNGDNFVPADYNTQDMRNINEKVNRILYGGDGANDENDRQVDINANAEKNHGNEINSFSSPDKRQEFQREAECYIYPNSDNEDYEDRNDNRKKPLKKKIIIGSVVAASVLLCVVLALVIQAVVVPKDNLLSDLGVVEKESDPVVIKNDKGEFIFAQGCQVSDVNIGGMTMVEAKKALVQKEKEARPDMEITVNIDDDSTVYTQDNFSFSYDTDQLLAEEKEFSEKLSQGTSYPTAEDTNGEDYYPESRKEISASLNDSSVEKLVKKIDKQYEVKAKDAKVESFNPSAENMFTYKEGSPGRSLDDYSVLSQINNIIEVGMSTGKYQGTVNENTKTVRSKVSVDFLKKNIVTLAKWETYSTNNANGNQNMKVSLEACDGSIIDPGDVWSFNDCTGDSNKKENGYAEAGVIVNGSYTDGVGGGICQSSTTIYNAAVRSNLGISERHNHTFPSSYAYSGFDAAIDYGNFDLKLKNNSKYQVFLSCYMSGTTLYATFYGVKDNSYDTIDTYSENYDITSSSYRSRAYRIYLDKDGKEIDREELPESYYSLDGGHSVQTADSGNNDYESGGRATGGDRGDSEDSSSSSEPQAPVSSQAPAPASSEKPKSSSSKPKSSSSKPKAESKPQSESKTESSASSKPKPSSSKAESSVSTGSSSSASSKPASPASSNVSEE